MAKTKINCAKDLSDVYQTLKTGEFAIFSFEGKQGYIETVESGKIVEFTDAGVVQTTPVADVTDFVIAVGDLVSTSNGRVTKLEHP